MWVRTKPWHNTVTPMLPKLHRHRIRNADHRQLACDPPAISAARHTVPAAESVPSLASALVGNKCTAKVNHYADGCISGKGAEATLSILLTAYAPKPFSRYEAIL